MRSPSPATAGATELSDVERLLMSPDARLTPMTVAAKVQLVPCQIQQCIVSVCGGSQQDFTYWLL